MGEKDGKGIKENERGQRKGRRKIPVSQLERVE